MSNKFIFVPLFFLITSVIGGLNYYSPVPVQDYWDQSINFYNEILDGNYSIWFSLHNEHRIVITRLLYYLVHKFIPDHEYFLTVINYFLFLLLYYLIIKFGFVGNYFQNTKLNIKLYFASFIFSAGFFWSQKLNFFFEVQSQVILSFILPLISFYFLDCYLRDNKLKNILLSVLIAVFSSFTIVSGILTLPIIALFLLFLRSTNPYIFFIITIFIINIFVYFSGYSSQNHSSIIINLVDYHVNIFDFFISLLGNPFSFLLVKSLFYQYISKLIGLFYIYLIFRKIRSFSKNSKSTNTIFICFSFYLIGVAILTSIGRVHMGVQEAFSGRYSSAIILLWISLILIYSNEIIRFFSTNPRMGKGILCIIIILMFIYQTTAFKDNENKFIYRKAASIALYLNIEDDEILNKIYPDIERLKSISIKAKTYNISIFRKLKDLFDSDINKNYILENFDQYDLKYINNEFSRIVFDDERYKKGFYVFRGINDKILGYGFSNKHGKFVGYIYNN